MMRTCRIVLRLCIAALLGTCLPTAHAIDSSPATPTATPAPLPDSPRLERELQHLPWPQFKAVIEAVPRLKADVDAYGPLGWQYIKGRYSTYAWRKNIDRLDPAQKRQLDELVHAAKKRTHPLAP
jgi:hypothetical protein